MDISEERAELPSRVFPPCSDTIRISSEEVLLSTASARARRLGAKFGPSAREKSTYIMSPLARVQVGYNIVDSGRR